MMATDHVHHHHSAHHHHHHQKQQQQQFSMAPNNIPPPVATPSLAPLRLPPPPQLALRQNRQYGRSAASPNNIADDAPPSDLMELDMPPSPLVFVNNLPSPHTPLPQLPFPEETPPNIIPPELQEATQNWRQYAAAALFHGRRLTGPSRKINQDMSNWEMEEEAEEQERQGQDEIDDDGTNFRGRRTTVTYRFPTNSSVSTEEQQQQQRRRAVARKLSMGHQRRSAEDSRYADEQQFQQSLNAQQAGSSEQRRLSFQERSLLSANYAILRKSVDRFEVVGAFHRCHSEAYRHFLQSLTCYDLAPQHGLIVMLDAELTILKAVQVLCAHPSPRVAVISNTRDGYYSMFTVTDCLLALRKAHDELDADLGGYTLRHFLENVQNGRRLISVDDQSSVWDLARVFTLNRVHRLPVFSTETAELIAILCPRAICVELLKLLNSKCSLSPDLNSIPLNSRLIGTWLNGNGDQEIAFVTEGDNCAKAINIFLDRQVSALPVFSSQDHSLLGVLDKNDLLDRLFERLGSHQSPERCFQLMEETPVEDLLPKARRRTLRADCSVADAMRVLTEDGLSESLFIVEPNVTECGGERLCGVLSHTDILAFILSCEQQQLSGCNSISASLDRPE